MTLRSRLFLVIGGLLLLVAGCSVWVPDLVEHRQIRAFERPRKIAVVPFYPSPLLSKRAKSAGTEAWEAAALVTRFVTEAIEERPVEVVPEHDMVIAFEGQGQVVPRREPGALARLAHAELGAEAILLGEVRRYRAREGSAYGSFSPASVEFEVTLYSAPDAAKLWVARFDQTQDTLTGNLFTSARYPSGGTRFLTVAELARWGASLVAAKLPLER